MKKLKKLDDALFNTIEKEKMSKLIGGFSTSGTTTTSASMTSTRSGTKDDGTDTVADPPHQ